ncbi:hypothetical protein IAU59_001678 [Kwoniella sp. CBS 9459]
MLTTLVSLITAVALLGFSKAAFPIEYIGCYNFSAGIPPGSDGALDFNASSAADCAASCRSNVFTTLFAYYYHVNSSGGVCRCSDVSPPGNAWVGSTWSPGACSQGYGAYSELSAPEFIGCYSAVRTPRPKDIIVPDIETCLYDTCGTANPAGHILEYIFLNHDAHGKWHCYCSYDVADYLPYPKSAVKSCDTGAYWVYNFTGSCSG